MALVKRHRRHKYYKVEVAQNKVWACALPDCTHYLPKHMEKLANGKDSFCWGCNEHITLNPANMNDDHPQCENCKMGISPITVETEAPVLNDTLAAFLNGGSIK